MEIWDQHLVTGGSEQITQSLQNEDNLTAGF